jgi:S1-C subfamily serine protease
MTAIFIAAVFCADPGRYNSVVKLNSATSQSSGAVIQQRQTDMLILTCAHGKKLNQYHTVTVGGHAELKGWVVCIDEKRDLAIISSELTRVRVNSIPRPRAQPPALGDIVRIKGYGFGHYTERQTTVVGVNNVTAGGNVRDRLRVKGETKPGDSGGVLINDWGQLIGISNSYSTGQKDVDGFFVTLEDIRDFLDENGVQL